MFCVAYTIGRPPQASFGFYVFVIVMIGNAASGNAAAVLQLQAKVPQWLTGRDEVTDAIQRELITNKKWLILACTCLHRIVANHSSCRTSLTLHCQDLEADHDMQAKLFEGHHITETQNWVDPRFG